MIPLRFAETKLITPMDQRTLVVLGDNPEALALAVLFAEAGTPNYLIGPFGEDGRSHTNRPGIEEALWLLDILTRSGKISLQSQHQLSTGDINTWILSTHASTPSQVNSLELTLRNLAPHLTRGSNIVFSGLCRPYYTSTMIRQTIERHGGLRIGSDLSLYYLPLVWSGEKLQEFREKPKVLAHFPGTLSNAFQANLLRIFPSISMAPSLEHAEAAGMFTAISREVSQALGLEFANMSESYGLNRDEVLDLCKEVSPARPGRSNPIPGREAIGTQIALSFSPTRARPKLVRAAHSINENYQRRLVDMVNRALRHCGCPFRRSRIAILGTDGLLRNAWSRPEAPPIILSLRRKGAEVSVYPGESGSQPWTRIVGEYARVENSLLKAVSKANCTVVALPESNAWEVNAGQLAAEMNRPGAICDLTGVLEASNVEKAGLFYTSIGRGLLDG